MALQTTITHMEDLLGKISSDLNKAKTGNKAAAQRVRTLSVRLEKTAKSYRKESISSEKGSKGKKPAKKLVIPKHKKAMAKPAPKMKAKQPAKAMVVKKPTAKLPVRRAF